VKMRRIVWVLAAAAMACMQGVAARLPAWTDDSGVTLRAVPESFAAGRESVKLTAVVFHTIDVLTRAQYTFTIESEQGVPLRTLGGEASFRPGEPMEFTIGWDGRAEDGAPLPDARYTVHLNVELRADALAGVVPDTEDVEERVEQIQQTRSISLQVLSKPLKKADFRVLAQAGQDPLFPFNHYYGTLHTQTSYSDGGHPNDANCASSTTHAAGDFTPAQAYSYARNTARLDFLGISDHNHQFNDACTGCSAPQVIQRYHDGLAAAASATVDGSFAAIYGMEWGYISNPSYPNEGHVGLFEIPKLFGWEPSSCTVGSNCYYEVFTDPAGVNYPKMYTAALANPSQWGAFGQFNHPSDGTKSAAGQGLDYNSFQYTADGDDVMHTIAVISGPATDYSTAGTDTGNRYAGEPINGPNYSPYNSTDMYNRALSAGFHVGPAADSDVHCSNYGTSTRDRTVIAATALTKTALLDALHHRRVYATSLPTAQLAFTMNANGTTYYMGDGGIRTAGPVATSGSITLHSSVYDSGAHTVTSIKIKEPAAGATDGSANLVASATTSPFDFTLTPAAGKHTYYVYVTLSTGDEMWSAPIWINQTTGPDTTAPTTAITAPTSGSFVKGAVAVSATATDNVGVTKVEFYLDGLLQSTATTAPYSWSWNTAASADGSHTLTTKAYDAAANVGISTAVSVTVDNAAPSTSITAPVAGSTVSGTVTVTASASDNMAVTKVEFYLDGSLRSTATTSPYSLSWNSATAANGTHTLTSKAYDAAGNATTSTGVSVTASNVDNVAPTAPSGLTATGGKRKITLSWTASTDNVGVTGYRVFRAASAAGPFSQIATTTGTTYTDSLATGTTRSYYVQATDAAGNVSPASNTASATAR
jgi:hypothetical protein